MKTFNQYKHIHPIQGKQKKIVDKAIRTIHGNIQADDLWQFGKKGGLRLICNKLNNSYISMIVLTNSFSSSVNEILPLFLFALFLDYHN